jgi:hypothetical protein
MSKSLLQIASQMRGLYHRVSVSLGVHPSYVSRVARGERKSPKIEEYLNREILKLLASAAGKPKAKK